LNSLGSDGVARGSGFSPTRSHAILELR